MKNYCKTRVFVWRRTESSGSSDSVNTNLRRICIKMFCFKATLLLLIIIHARRGQGSGYLGGRGENGSFEAERRYIDYHSEFVKMFYWPSVEFQDKKRYSKLSLSNQVYKWANAYFVQVKSRSCSHSFAFRHVALFPMISTSNLSSQIPYQRVGRIWWFINRILRKTLSYHCTQVNTP